MTKKNSITFFAFIMATIIIVGCGKEEEPHVPLIDGLTLENFPVMDGSTSTEPLIKIAASQLLGYKYEWGKAATSGTTSNGELHTTLPANFKEQKLLSTQTHGSIENLIDGGTDMIFVARTLSEDEKAYAEQKGVTLIEKPIALDALVFIVCNRTSFEDNYTNPVNSLTHQQIQDIYTKRTTNWNEVGGDDLPIVPFVRNANSGSQELMKSLVMTEPLPDGFWEDHFEDDAVISSMAPLFSAVVDIPGGLGYTVYYYLWKMMSWGGGSIKALSINGIMPEWDTISNRTYPFTAPVYMMIRSDLDKSSMAYKVYEYMQTTAGQGIVAESGYVPIINNGRNATNN
jgi:phosphate transport system substrate-binding protein